MSKLPEITTSIFAKMSQQAAEFGAVNLSQGFPNFPVDERFLEIVAKLNHENVHQYAPMAGVPFLLEKIANLTYKNYQRKVSTSTDILVTSGATQGIYCTINALIKQGDEVITLDPSYDSYEPSIKMAGGISVRVALNDDYTPNFNAIEDAITPKTKMIVINNPHNPTGKIWSEKEFEILEDILERNPQILVLADEVYEYITFEQKHISFHTRPKLLERTIVASSFGKSLHITGWKVGYLIAPEKLIFEIKKVHQFVVFSVNTMGQHAIAQYLDIVDLSEVSSMYQAKRDLFQKALSQSRFTLLPCEGTYFQVVNFSEISSKTDVDFAHELVSKHKVAAIPISTFYSTNKDNQMLRFCFAKTDETLNEALEILCGL
jgi:methionine transaminase